MIISENWQQIIVIVSFLVVFLSFFVPVLAPEVMAIFCILLFGAIGILNFDSSNQYYVFSPFVHPAPLTIIAVFILGTALQKSGIVDLLTIHIEKLTRFGEVSFLILLMLIVGFLSCLMNNTPLVVIFIPIVISICNSKGYKASKFLIPLSYASIAGGTMTIIGTSTNMVANNILAQKKEIPFAMFDLFPVGGAFLLVTIVYMALIGRKFLPSTTIISQLDIESQREFITHSFVNSSLAGKSLKDLEFGKGVMSKILAIWRRNEKLEVFRDFKLEEGDEIVFQGKSDFLRSISKTISGEGEKQSAGYIESTSIIEVIVTSNSPLIGLSFNEVKFEKSDELFFMAVHRGGKNVSASDSFFSNRISKGDILLLEVVLGPNQEKALKKWELVSLRKEKNKKSAEINKKKALFSLVALGFFVFSGIFMSLGILPRVPLVILAIFAACFTLLTKCLSFQDAYRGVDWRVIFLIIGMLGLSMGFQSSGLSDLISEACFDSLGLSGIAYLVPIFYLLSVFLTELMSNNGVAALLTPMAIITANQFAISPEPLVAAVMFGASASFLTPVGYQTNLFVYNVGGYRFRDFFVAGLPLAVSLFFVASWLIPKVWPLS